MFELLVVISVLRTYPAVVTHPEVYRVKTVVVTATDKCETLAARVLRPMPKAFAKKWRVTVACQVVKDPRQES